MFTTELFELLDFIPDLLDETLTMDGVTVHMSNIDGVKELKIYTTPKIETEINEYKECIEKLDDDMFVEAIEEVGESIDLSTFDKLLEKGNLTEDEIDVLEYMMTFTKNVIVNHIDKRIEDLLNLRDEI